MKRRASCGSAIVQYGLPMGLMGLVGVLVVVGSPDTGMSASISKLIGGTLGASSSASQNNASGASSMQVASFGTQSLSAQQAAASGGNTTLPTMGNGNLLTDPGAGVLPPNSGFGSIRSLPTETGGTTLRMPQPGSTPQDDKGQDPGFTTPEPSPGYCDTRIGACTTGGTKLPSEGGGSMTSPNGGNTRTGGNIGYHPSTGYGGGTLPNPLLPGNLGDDGLPIHISGGGSSIIHASESGGTTNLTTQGGGQTSNNGPGLMLDPENNLSPALNKFP